LYSSDFIIIFPLQPRLNYQISGIEDMHDRHEIQPAEPHAVNLVQITDTHILADPDARFDGVDTAATLAAVVDAVNRLEPAPDAILLTGDLVHEPEQAAYARLRPLLERLPSPVFCLPGNHDQPELLRRCLAGGAIHCDKVLDLGPWCVVLLDTWLAGSHAGRLAPAELQLLEGELEAGRSAHYLVALHHPPVSVDSPWMDAMGLENGGELLSVLDVRDGVRGVIWGHIHQEYRRERGRTLLLGTPSTCVQFKPHADRYIRDERPPGFRQLSLRPDGTIETRLQRVV
jgi:Icc protein